MQFCKLTAIIQSDRCDDVEKKLTELGIAGFTISKVKGIGEYRNYYEKEGLAEHIRIEIYLPESSADTIAEGIMEVAHTGAIGDGIVVISPVRDIYRIRTREKCKADETC